jgi:organic radical activating enzyme
MQEYVDKYKIENSFLERYFIQNTNKLIRFKSLELKYLHKKDFFVLIRNGDCFNILLQEEIKNFYEKGELNIPYFELVVTTKCTLKCKHCANFMPLFTGGGGGNSHFDLTFETFQQDFDSFMNCVDHVREMRILGGEPLINKELHNIVEYSAKNDKIQFIEIVTNGTIVPDKNLIDVIKRYDNKIIMFYLSDYSKNKELKKILKHEELIKALTDNNIGYETNDDLIWRIDGELRNRKHSPEKLRDIFLKCDNNMCNSLFDGKLHVCPKSSSGHRLNLINADDYVDLRQKNIFKIKKDLINFYKKDYFEACKYCRRTSEKVLPAIQIK